MTIQEIAKFTYTNDVLAIDKTIKHLENLINVSTIDSQDNERLSEIILVLKNVRINAAAAVGTIN